MSRLGWLASRLLGRRPDAEFIRDDLQELYARDRADGVPAWRAHWRFARRLADSCVSVWTVRRATWMDEVRADGTAQDLRFALRLFRKHPASIGIALVGLAVAMAVATSVFTVVDAVMLRPYGMDDPSSVVSIDEPRHGWPLWPYSSFLKIQDASTLARVEASLSPRVRFSAVSTPGTESNHRARFVSGGYLGMLGGRPAMGRPIGPQDDLPGAPPVIMVSHRFWSAALGADPAAIGRTMWLNGTPVTLVGVMSQEFTGPNKSGGPAIWAPMAAYDDVLGGRPLTRSSNELVEVVARLAPGASPRALEESLTAVVQAWNAPAESGERRRVRIASAASPVSGRDSTEAYLTILFVFGIVGLVLAVACANAANLLLAAATTRAFEMGTRLALGASPARLFRQTLSESLLLGAVAAGLGFGLSIWFVPVLRAMLDLPLELPAEVASRPDARALAFTMAVGLVCGLGAGLSPARYGARGDVLSAVRSQATPAGRRAVPSRLRASFVGFQAAVSIILLIAAALLGRSAIRSIGAETGFDVDRLLTVAIGRGATPGYYQSALEAIRALPSIEQVSVSQYEPYGPSVEREFLSQGGKGYQVNVSRADADYFSTLGLRIVRGRAFTADEVAREAPVALISESVARAFYEGIDPIGQPLSKVARRSIEDDPATIVGIVADAQLSPLWSERSAAIYRPIRAKPVNPPSLIVRARLPGLTRSAVRGIDDALKRLDPLKRPQVTIVRDELDEYLGIKRMLSSLSAPIALLAALLATVGVFGVTAFAVGQRTGEISVRMALGASSLDVCRLLMVDSLRPVVIGLVAGVAAALIASRVFASLLGGISPHDPLSIVAAVGLLIAASLAAVLLPVRRAARAEPASLLRAG
jgi:predicted permease